MSNIKFSYFYRDAGNYKKWADVVFSNRDGVTLESVARSLTAAFLQDGLFIADQIRIPEAFLFDQGDATSDDHCFHEFNSVEMSPDDATDMHSRSITQFIAEVDREAMRGWAAFDPHDVSRQRA
jgi:hypothetical protein